MKEILSIVAEIKELQAIIKKGKSLSLQFPNDKILLHSIVQHEFRLKSLRKELAKLKKEETLPKAA